MFEFTVNINHSVTTTTTTTTTDDWVFVDFQGFKDNFNRFIVKEFATATKNSKFHDLIKSPHSITILDEEHQKQAKWLTENYHGLNWNSGNICLSELRNTVQPIFMNKIVYVKGEEKIKWFKNMLKFEEDDSYTVVNVESIGCQINLNKKNAETNHLWKKYHACNKHSIYKNKQNPKCHCAMENVLILSDWYLQKTKPTT